MHQTNDSILVDVLLTFLKQGNVPRAQVVSIHQLDRLVSAICIYVFSNSCFTSESFKLFSTLSVLSVQNTAIFPYLPISGGS